MFAKFTPGHIFGPRKRRTVGDGGRVNFGSFFMVARLRATSSRVEGHQALKAPINLVPCAKPAFGFWTGCISGLLVAVAFFMWVLLSQ